MADRSAATGRTVYRDPFSELLVWRFAILGAAAVGFLVTFILLDHEIRAFKDVILPLLVILPAYLFLMSLNTWWAAQTMAKQGLIQVQSSAEVTNGLRRQRIVKAACGLAFGVLAALWYVHSVSR